MIPSNIFSIMDLARRARAAGEVFNPLFNGAPGVGKSQIVQAWAKANNLPFIDIRAAYLEAPDMIGFPSIETNEEGRQVTVHNTPEFWPFKPDWEGVVLLEEVNRGTQSIMNCMMQILTDRKVHKYALPEKAIIVGCVNPDDSGNNDVNTMDPALKDRFVIFNVGYDKNSFVEYMKQKEWDQNLILFVENGLWNYTLPEDVKNAPGAKYISPRTLATVNAARKSFIEEKDELLVYQSTLGGNVGKDFYTFLHNESPVFFTDLVKSPKSALKKLQKFADPTNYKSGMIEITVKDVLENGTIDDKLLADLVTVLPVEKGPTLIRELEFKRKDDKILIRICDAYPAVKKLFRETLQYGKTNESVKSA